MTTEQYQIGYEEGYQEGWNAAMDDAKVAANKKNFSLHVWNNGNTVVWPKFLPEFKSKICKHEDDGFCYTSNPPKYKCKICGEFFRNQQAAPKAAPASVAGQMQFGGCPECGSRSCLARQCSRTVSHSAQATPGVQWLCGQQASGFAAPQQEAQEPVMIYHGRCTIDCGEHGHHDVEMLRMIPAGSKLYTAPQPAPAPLSDDAKDAARYVALRDGSIEHDDILKTVKDPGKWEQPYAVLLRGIELDSAIDAALAAQGGKA